MNNTHTNPSGFWPQRLSWRTIVLIILTIVTFIAVSGPSVRYAVPMMGVAREGGGVVMDSVSSGGALPPTETKGAPDVYYPYPYPNPDVPITDTREFLKVYYSAFMRARNVQGLTRRVETTVRGFGGRIDQQSSSQYYGSVSFAVPQSKYDAFRTEVESLVPSRFITTNISSQNLLPQKQSIEEQQKQAGETLANYRAERQKIITTHSATVQSLQAQLAASTDQGVIASLTQQLANENSSYTALLNTIERRIASAEKMQKALQTQDQELLDNVATVTGTISIEWISLWGIALLYLPGYWIPILLAALTLLSLVWDRRRLGAL